MLLAPFSSTALLVHCSLRLAAAQAVAQRALAGRERRVRLAEGQREGRGALHLPPGRRSSPARARVGRDQRPARRRRSCRRCGSAGTTRAAGASTARAGTGRASRTAASPTTARRSPCWSPRARRRTGRTGRCRPGSGASRCSASTRGFRSQSQLGAPRRALLRRAPEARDVPELVVRRSLAERVRPLHVPRPAHLRLRRDREGRAEGQVRPEPLHRHAQLAVRTGLAPRVRDPHAPRDGHVLSQLRPAAAVRGVSEPGHAPGGRRRASSGHRRWPRRDAGDAGGARRPRRGPTFNETTSSTPSSIG